MYIHFWKRIIDVVMLALGIPMIIISLIIKKEEPGTAIFKQKHVGVHKCYFYLLKFRSMRLDTPHDVWPNMLKNPEKYLFKYGKTLRKYSLDELFQIFNIFKGNMSIIGSPPALWNQYNLIAERDKYGEKDVKFGLTGWAQINGKDELEIPVKAKLDGEYVEKESFLFDCKCFFGTIGKVLKHDGAVEAELVRCIRRKE